MTTTNFPNGIASFGMPVLGSGFGIPPTTGSVFFVHSGTGANGNPGDDPSAPLATIDYAIGKCTANKADLIIVMPGHAETLSGAGAIAADVAGISIIGLGNGTNRPVLTLHTAATTIAVSAANITFSNLVVATDVDAVVKIFNVTAANCTINAVDFKDTANCAPLSFVTTSAAADGLVVQNCVWVQTLAYATATQEWLKIVGADGFVCRNNIAFISGFPTGNPANGFIVGATTASLGVTITDNVITCNSGGTGDVAISLLATSTGFVARNVVGSAKTAIAGSVALASAFGAENYAVNTANKSGILDPVADT